jgi:hypothetical protein
MGLTTTKYFRWDDPGALKLDGTAGSFYAIIKHCLTGAGWSVAFDDPVNFKIALRNSLAHGGSGGYLRVHDNASFTGGGRVASWQAYESMSDIDTGTLQCCDDWIWKAREAGGAQGADAVRRCWVIVADERTCYLSTWVGDDNASPRGVNPSPPDLTGVNAGYLCMSAFAGDIEPFVAGDPGFGGCGMTGQNPATGTIANVPSWLGARRASNGPSTTTTMRLSRNAALSASVTQVAVAANEVPTNTIGHGSASSPLIQSNSPLIVLPGLVVDGVTLRGRMRGLYVPQNNLTTNGGAPMGIEVTPFLSSSTANMVCLAGAVTTSTNGITRLFVETAKSWDDI